ncbi:MAG: dienelactone hydrolase family protein [Deltaproteobacteria bacterium]|nr:dienelactone hydrolase family protein [Deltaproteobacteria bacterium]
MIERELDVPTQDGEMNTFVVQPETGGPHPVVLFYMDAPGKREELNEMARRIAAAGYFVALPNLYYRKVREFQMERTDDGMKRMFEMMGHLSNALIAEDTKALLAFLVNEPGASQGPAGVVGYCMSGPFALAAAAAFPQRFAAVASIYGTPLVTDRDDSPHLMLDRISGELYFACAEFDSYAPREQIDALAIHLEAAGTNHRIEWYPGTQHGFAFPQRDAYHELGAERHWERLFDLFERNLT